MTSATGTSEYTGRIHRGGPLERNKRKDNDVPYRISNEEFLEAMRMTNLNLHSINGKPRYQWKDKKPFEPKTKIRKKKKV